jgi:hypothetical protein
MKSEFLTQHNQQSSFKASSSWRISSRRNGPEVRPHLQKWRNSIYLRSCAFSFWSRALTFTSPSSARRFVANFGEYTDAVAQEAQDRDHGRVRSIEDYLDLRRGTIGVKPSFDFFLLPEDLPDEVLAHPCIERLVLGAIDMTILANVSVAFSI